MTHERHLQLARAVNDLLTCYESPESQQLAITRLTMPLSHILKNPDQERWRTIQTSNTLMKPVVMNKKE